jgi:glyoxylase-like metal-dependent hydrolase (beta-lactamase superfamily II)
MRLTPEVYLVGGGNLAFNLSDDFDSHVYVVDGRDELALIDTGTGRAESEILANARDDGIDVRKIRFVLLTHGHLDHAGGAGGLRSSLGARVLASAPTADFLRRGDDDAISLTAARQAGMYPADYRLRPTEVDRELHDGDRVRVGALELQVLETPGHCTGHLCFVLRTSERTCLFSGDMLFFGGTIAIQRIWDCDLQAYVRSIERLRGLAADAFFPGHLSISLKHGQRHIDSALARLDQLLIPQNLM